MSQLVRIDGKWTVVPDTWKPGDPAPATNPAYTGDPSYGGGPYSPGGSTPTQDNPFARFFGPLAGGLDQPTLGPPIHWTPGPAPYVPFMRQAQMPSGIDIQRFISPAVQNLWGQLPPPSQPPPIPQYPTDPAAPGGIPGSGPSGEPLLPQDPFGGQTPTVDTGVPGVPTGATPILPPPPEMMPQPAPGPTPILPPPGYTQPVLQQPTTTWYDPYQLYPQQYPTLQPAPTYSPTLAPWTDVSMLPSSPSGSMAGWDSGALY